MPEREKSRWVRVRRRSKAGLFRVAALVLSGLPLVVPVTLFRRATVAFDESAAALRALSPLRELSGKDKLSRVHLCSFSLSRAPSSLPSLLVGLRLVALPLPPPPLRRSPEDVIPSKHGDRTIKRKTGRRGEVTGRAEGTRDGLGRVGSNTGGQRRLLSLLPLLHGPLPLFLPLPAVPDILLPAESLFDVVLPSPSLSPCACPFLLLVLLLSPVFSAVLVPTSSPTHPHLPFASLSPLVPTPPPTTAMPSVEQNPKLRIAVVGAGPAGLGALIALSKIEGVDVQAYEAARELREVGAVRPSCPFSPSTRSS